MHPNLGPILFNKVRPSLDLNFLNGVIDGRLTCSGGANGTVVSSAGLIVAATCPRFDYSPTSKACLGLLVEEARTNEALRSRDLTNASWTKVTATAALDQTGIDGAANSASSLLATAGNATCLQVVTEAAATRVFSAYVKRITGTGTVQMTEDGGTTWTDVTSQINASTYTRVQAASQSVLNPSIGFRLVTSGDKIAIDGIQNEAGAFATSVVFTTSASVTRSADSVSMTGTNFSSWFNPAQGTFVVEGDWNFFGSGLFGGMATVTDGTSNNAMGVLASQTAFIAEEIVTSGVTQATLLPLSTPVVGTVYRTALAYASNDFAASINSGTIVSTTSGVVPQVNRLIIGVNRGISYLNGHIRRIRYYPQRLSNAKLQVMTAP